MTPSIFELLYVTLQSKMLSDILKHGSHSRLIPFRPVLYKQACFKPIRVSAVCPQVYSTSSSRLVKRAPEIISPDPIRHSPWPEPNTVPSNPLEVSQHRHGTNGSSSRINKRVRQANGSSSDIPTNRRLERQLQVASAQKSSNMREPPFVSTYPSNMQRSRSPRGSVPESSRSGRFANTRPTGTF